MQYQTAIFDLDGTLLYTLEDLYLSTNYALERHGLPPRTMDEVRRFVGNGIGNLIRLAVAPRTSHQLIDAVHATFDMHYSAHNLDHTCPYPGVIELLKQLRSSGMRCCVVSNKGDYAVQPLVEHFFGGLFDVVCGEREREGIRRKPWPDTVLACMEKTSSSAKSTVYVGDSEVDILTARNAGIECVLVGWGFRDEAYLCEQGARVVVHTTGELEAQLLALGE